MTVIYVPATIAHAEAMIGRLRSGDAAEVEAFGLSQRDALLESVNVSLFALAALEDGVPIALFGVAADDMMGSTGRPWMLTTAEVERHKKQFLRDSRHWIENVQVMYPSLENWVDARYERAIRWLRWLGFTIHPAASYGLLGADFHHFTMER